MPRVPPRFLTIESKILRGVRRFVQVPQPAVGAEWVVSVEGGRQWRLIGGQATLATSGVVQNRSVGIQFTCGGVIVQRNANISAIPANNNRVIEYQPNSTMYPNNNFAGQWQVPFTPLWLEAGDQIGSITLNLDVGDQYSGVQLLMEQAYFTNQDLRDEELADEAAVESFLTGGGTQ